MAASSMGSKEGSTKTIVAEQISQSVQSTSNLLHLMLQSSPSHVLQQMPQVISSLDAHVESGLQSVPHLKTVVQLLSNMETGKLKSLSRDQHNSQEAPEPVEQHSEVA